MPIFKYSARSADGNLIEGTVESADRTAAIFTIEKDRAVPIRVEAVGLSSEKRSGNAKTQRPALAGSVQTLSYNDQFLFTEQLAHLLGAGMTLDEALAVLEKRLQQPKLKTVSSTLHRGLVDGQSLSQALRAFPRIFTPLYVNMVAAGEASGALAEILRRLTVHLADIKSLRDRVQQALVYPAVLFLAGVGLIIVFMTVMVPQLTSFFATTGQELPLPTRILLAGNRLIVGYWWVGVGLAVCAFSAWKAFTRAPEGRRAWDAFILRIPGYGQLIRYRYYAQFARTLATLIDNGLILLRALELLEEISGNEHIRRNMVEVRKAVIDGASLSNALRGRNLFPELFLDMMAVGEQTGRFGETMHMVAGVYERELDKQVSLVSALIPPLIMVMIATVVGLVVFGILSAVFNLTSGLRNRVG